MARAYPVLCRNDLEDSLLQVLDLKPHPTPSQGMRVYEGASQGGYQTFYLLDGINAAVATQAGALGGASLDCAGDTYGLSAYLLNHVEDTGGNESLTAAEAVTISGLIEAAASAGTALTLAIINTYINTPAGVAGSDLNGTLGNSTGTVEEILRILAGERWLLPDLSQVRTAAGIFDVTDRGYFVTRPSVLDAGSVTGTYGSVRGRKSTAPMSHLRAGEPRTAPVQSGTEDVNFNDVRVTVDTGHLHASVLSGALSELVSTTFTFENPAFTYGAAGDAATLASGTITDGIARALVVYDADGNVI